MPLTSKSFEAMGFSALERTPTHFVAGGGRRVRIVFDLEARPAAGGSVLSTETRVAAGDPVFVRALAERGGWERWDRVQAWLVDRRETFTAALLN